MMEDLDLPAPEPGRPVFWLVRMDAAPRVIRTYEPVLSREEAWQASRFREDRARMRSVLTRGVLRLLLSRYQGMNAADLAFERGPHGKPRLIHGDERLRFNVAHSGEFGLIGVSVDADIGVDLERIRPETVTRDLARACLTPREAEVLCALEPREMAQRLHWCWARKEALVKGHGAGGSLDPREVSVPLGGPGAAAGWISRHPDGRRWSLWDIAAPEGYAAATAVDGECRGAPLFAWEHPGVEFVEIG